MQDLSHIKVNENAMKKLFQTNDPKKLFNDILNKSLPNSKSSPNSNSRHSIAEGMEIEELDYSPLPPVQSKASNTGQRIPKMYQQESVHEQNSEMLKQMLGEQYFNKLRDSRDDGGGSIFESVVNKTPSGGYDNYEVVSEQPKTNQISLTIGGKAYNGKIIQNKKGQILYLVNQTQAFILSPSDLKTVSKK